MKTFSTSGTGSQQTLSEIESDKIPIYNSLTDAEADLANLEEGQIFGTKDKGSELSAPVDVVQSGNMHAVTSNAVAGALSYSTTEQVTGGTWIDGKPIYRKVLITTEALNVSTWGFAGLQTEIQSMNIAKIIKCTCLVNTTNPYINNLLLAETSLGFLVEQAGISVGSHIIMEYTKTTD